MVCKVVRMLGSMLLHTVYLLSIAQVQSLCQWNLHAADTTKVHSRAGGLENLTHLRKVGWRLRENMWKLGSMWYRQRMLCMYIYIYIPFNVDAWTSSAKLHIPWTQNNRPPTSPGWQKLGTCAVETGWTKAAIATSGAHGVNWAHKGMSIKHQTKHTVGLLWSSMTFHPLQTQSYIHCELVPQENVNVKCCTLLPQQA